MATVSNMRNKIPAKLTVLQYAIVLVNTVMKIKKQNKQTNMSHTTTRSPSAQQN